MKTKHTPGPWNILEARTLANVKGKNGEQICQVAKGSPDADLIAAAPDMLMCLEELVPELAKLTDQTNARAILEVLKKARGE